jgi:hypothetical protein
MHRFLTILLFLFYTQMLYGQQTQFKSAFYEIDQAFMNGILPSAATVRDLGFKESTPALEDPKTVLLYAAIGIKLPTAAIVFVRQGIEGNLRLALPSSYPGAAQLVWTVTKSIRMTDSILTALIAKADSIDIDEPTSVYIYLVKTKHYHRILHVTSDGIVLDMQSYLFRDLP